jgi:hypothetical protein
MQIGEREREPLPFLGSERLIDITRLHGLSAPLMATSVAYWLHTSGETGGQDIRPAVPPALGFKRPIATAARKL